MPVGGMSRAACTQEHVATPGRMTTKYIDTMEYVTLNNGVRMPQMGYGVYQVDPKECERCVSDAISVGYRLIDTAQAYHNEEGVGEAIAKCGEPRGELFIVSKIWITNAGEEKADASIRQSLSKRQCDYAHHMHIHPPLRHY